MITKPLLNKKEFYFLKEVQAAPCQLPATETQKTALKLWSHWAGRDLVWYLLLRRFGDGTESNLRLLHHSGGTITYCSPKLENTIHRSSAAQWAKSEGCFALEASSAKATVLVFDTC